MSGLRTNTITIRGESFTVSELTAKAMRGARNIAEKDRTRFEMYVASAALVTPRLTEAELLEMPQIISEKISEEALRLTKDDDSAKNA